MNKKILVLAFVSAMFFFGCAADGGFSGNAPPEWDSAPSSINPPAGEPRGGYCIASGMCIKINGYFTEMDCYDLEAQIADSCPVL